MESKINDLTAEQYHALYLRAFARLEDLARQAEQAMEELEELQLSMGELEELQLSMGDPPA